MSLRLCFKSVADATDLKQSLKDRFREVMFIQYNCSQAYTTKYYEYNILDVGLTTLEL